jgi:hypothetical protein
VTRMNGSAHGMCHESQQTSSRKRKESSPETGSYQRVSKNKRNGWGIRSNASHPGATLTNLQTTGPTLGRGSTTLMERLGRQMTRMIPGFWQEIAQGVLPTLYAATSPLALGGGYYGPGGFAELTGMPAVARIPRRARNEQIAQRLWQVSEQLTSVSFPPDHAA